MHAENRPLSRVQVYTYIYTYIHTYIYIYYILQYQYWHFFPHKSRMMTPSSIWAGTRLGSLQMPSSRSETRTGNAALACACAIHGLSQWHGFKWWICINHVSWIYLTMMIVDICWIHHWMIGYPPLIIHHSWSILLMIVDDWLDICWSMLVSGRSRSGGLWPSSCLKFVHKWYRYTGWCTMIGVLGLESAVEFLWIWNIYI